MQSDLFTLLLISIALFALGCASPQPSSSVSAQNGSSISPSPLKIEVLGFDACPNTQPLLENVQRAADTLHVAAEVRYINQEHLAHDDLQRGWPAPTILVNGKDLFGMEPPKGPAMGCRMYPGGTPSEAALTAALQAMLAK